MMACSASERFTFLRMISRCLSSRELAPWTGEKGSDHSGAPGSPVHTWAPTPALHTQRPPPSAKDTCIALTQSQERVLHHTHCIQQHRQHVKTEPTIHGKLYRGRGVAGRSPEEDPQASVMCMANSPKDSPTPPKIAPPTPPSHTIVCALEHLIARPEVLNGVVVDEHVLHYHSILKEHTPVDKRARKEVGYMEHPPTHTHTHAHACTRTHAPCTPW